MDMNKIRAELGEWVRAAAGAFVIYLVFTTVAFAQYAIPSESMVPHLEVGDRVTVSKFAYGYSRHSLPLNIGALLPASERRLFGHAPRRGDVAVFISPYDGKTLIKRVVGLPGDVIQVRGGTLWINGEQAQRSAPEPLTIRTHDGDQVEVERFEETLPGGVTHATDSLIQGGPGDFGPAIVPAGHFFAMGDNRDRSLDSPLDRRGADGKPHRPRRVDLLC